MSVTWIGDHPPRHVHAYKDGKLVLESNVKATDVEITDGDRARIDKVALAFNSLVSYELNFRQYAPHAYRWA